jgi:hypothetical protein
MGAPRSLPVTPDGASDRRDPIVSSWSARKAQPVTDPHLRPHTAPFRAKRPVSDCAKAAWTRRSADQINRAKRTCGTAAPGDWRHLQHRPPRPAGFGGHSRAQSRSSTRRFLVNPLRCGTPDSAAASYLTLGPAGTPARSSRTSASRSAAARSFVTQMTSRRDAVIVRSTVDLGRNLGLRVVAEGSRTRPPGRSWTRSAATRSRATTSADPYAPTNSSTGSNSSG